MSRQTQEPSKKTPVHKASSGPRFSPTSQGNSTFFYLSEAWVAKFLKTDSAVKPHVAELSPHKLDTEQDSAPCLPPRGSTFGYVDSTNVVHEKLAALRQLCDPGPQGKLFYADLWGRLRRIDKVDVFLKEDGALDVKFPLKNSAARRFGPATSHSGARAHLCPRGSRLVR